ncbi:hypothetical protein QP222_05570 [Corynebacterium pyruviciproducens]|uniref:hypothetical protein n=1 Tax=Corynebacterium pyruviciproducens TaxID=598660 RepID=UPI00254FE21A|nr:hypothetical protein [Corynebacterium pyruviciproducens]MDK6565877.1 hypothetical protein [Corynebacterium pyruviciproducens]
MTNIIAAKDLGYDLNWQLDEVTNWEWDTEDANIAQITREDGQMMEIQTFPDYTPGESYPISWAVFESMESYDNGGDMLAEDAASWDRGLEVIKAWAKGEKAWA